jgi:hypothetical protein
MAAKFASRRHARRRPAENSPPRRTHFHSPMEPIDFAMQAIFQPISTFAAALSGYD